ncbi:MAG TPA: ATP-dependent DNA helicase RecG, partial [Solirubrobacteraceae bacterium]|nr:ATP-dependent DNA helicase RecG [Solirubrobacteraceae bacterium]
MGATTPLRQPAQPGGETERVRPPARAFASTDGLTRQELIDAPVGWPRPSRLLTALEPPAKKMAAGMRALGLLTVGDLLEHLPSDSREARTVGALRAGEQATVAVQVRTISARSVRSRRMRPLVEATVFDATATMRATFFNQPWLVERYQPGTRLLLHGKADGRGGFGVSHHAPAGETSAELGEEAIEGDAVAHYPAAEGVTSTQILTLVRGARRALGDVIEALPASARIADGLPDRPTALAAMHFARGPQEAETGRQRLAYEELLLTQLLFLRRRAIRAARTGAHVLDEPATLSERWLRECLPFALTGDQRAAIDTISADLTQEAAMQRLLMGEVGSGKTVVALHAMLRAVEHGRQAALMAPTETLAEQHFATIQRLLGAESVTAALLSGSTPARRRADTLAKLSSGELSLIVGTHALIEPDVAFRELAVVVIDEQHRFGVRQRAALEEREPAHPPHTLHMTATPIPRTLALARYGDLDTTALHELPQGRRPVDTRLVSGESERAGAYEHLRAQLHAGRQAFVVCPLIEEPEPLAAGDGTPAGSGDASRTGLRAATAELARLRDGELKGFELALLHGGMRPREKQEAMAAFASGSADVLVATTVIEVGIDVPNATVMLIENAEHFGLAQLHQLRGRIGRGAHEGFCILISDAQNAEAQARLKILEVTNDGFRIAEADLKLRGPGDLLGQ